ncbi:MAG: hypothetical protein KAS32_19995 [Candidatus Peribacteraceae bacterium]|nr:hypothetical protein [Candidatus Peribacteraceae bacterium]
MSIKRSDLLLSYWGKGGYPSQWMEPEDIAETYKVHTFLIEQLLDRYKIERRTNYHYCHKAVWDVLCSEWNMVFKDDFDYRTKLNNVNVDFFLKSESIGITLVDNTDQTITNEDWYGESCLARFAVGDIEVLQEGIREFLSQYDVKKKVEGPANEDGNEW